MVTWSQPTVTHQLKCFLCFRDRTWCLSAPGPRLAVCAAQKDRRAKPANLYKAKQKKSGAIIFRTDRAVSAFDSGSVHTRRVMQTVAPGRVSVRVQRIAAVSFILPKLCTYLRDPAVFRRTSSRNSGSGNKATFLWVSWKHWTDDYLVLMLFILCVWLVQQTVCCDVTMHVMDSFKIILMLNKQRRLTASRMPN